MCYHFTLCVFLFDLARNYGLKGTRHISIEESVGIFLITLDHRCPNRHFHTILATVLKMSVNIIKPTTNYNDVVPEYILNNPNYYPMFQDCIGAIDKTHVPQSEEAKYIGRKEYVPQNFMVVCDFNMCFTFVLVGWEGSTHDTKIFNEVLQRQDLNFPHPTGG
uniref:DDE Tnp4 domain-containing protein n=1 Tax=Lactuca sativa TaxID=4236 RepID=A0A9R1XK99_LACSA|nr:hypothetical protein LSAT_V11C400210600 [Lactuca sativa]